MELNEKLQRQEWTAKFDAVLTTLGFTPKVRENNDSWDSSASGTKGNEGIYLSYSSYSKGKITVSGVYPRTAKGEYIRPYEYGESDHSIGVSINKTVAQIAKEIERRFMPLYRERLAKIEKRVASSNEYLDKTTATLEVLKGSAPTEQEIQNHKLWIEHGTVDVSGNEVKLNLSYLPVETAKKILDFIKSEVK